LVTHQLQVERRTGKVRRPETDVLPLCHATNNVLRMYYLFIMRQVICWFVYIGKNQRFTAFLDSNLHTRLAIVTENELGLAFPPRNLPKKFRPDPSTFYLVIVVTNRQTNRQTDKAMPVIT